MTGPQQIVDANAATTDRILYRIASSRAEREAAFRLVYDSYLEAGLGEVNSHRMRVTPYHLLPTTETFLATLDDQAVFTLSLITDGELGLPMESVYAPEIAQRREQGLVLGEVSCLADRRTQFRSFFPVFLRLCRLMVQYARRQELDQLVVVVHPRHVRFYRRFLDFRVIGEQRTYPTVRDNPAVALCLDFARIDRELPENYDTFFGTPLPPSELRPHPITAEDVEHFGSMIDPSFKPAPLAAELGHPDASPRSPSIDVA